MRGLILVLSALAAFSCVGSFPFDPPATAQLDSLFTLRAGQQAAVEGTGLRLRFLRVVDDSRCPTDVECVWAGDAQVQLVLTGGGVAEEGLNLHTSLEPRALVVGGYRVTLVRLEPAPRSEAVIAQERYVAELRVSRAR